jgi:hypothetical protein
MRVFPERYVFEQKRDYRELALKQGNIIINNRNMYVSYSHLLLYVNNLLLIKFTTKEVIVVFIAYILSLILFSIIFKLKLIIKASHIFS